MKRFIVALVILGTTPDAFADGWSWHYTGLTGTSQLAREVHMHHAFATLPNDHFAGDQYPYAQILNWTYFFNGTDFVEAGIGWDWAGMCRKMRGRKRGAPSMCIWWASQDYPTMHVVDWVPIGRYVDTHITKNSDATAMISWTWTDATMQSQTRTRLINTGTWTTELGYHPCQLEVAVNSVFNTVGGLPADAKPRNIHLAVDDLIVFPNDLGHIYSTEPDYFQAIGSQAGFMIDVP